MKFLEDNEETFNEFSEEYTVENFTEIMQDSYEILSDTHKHLYDDRLEVNFKKYFINYLTKKNHK